MIKADNVIRSLKMWNSLLFNELYSFWRNWLSYNTTEINYYAVSLLMSKGMWILNCLYGKYSRTVIFCIFVCHRHRFRTVKRCMFVTCSMYHVLLINHSLHKWICSVMFKLLKGQRTSSTMYAQIVTSNQVVVLSYFGRIVICWAVSLLSETSWRANN